MRPLNVLIGCESSGAVRDAFIAAGHHAMSCDLLASEVPGPHFQGDVFDAIALRAWDIGIFHPPCTYLCSSGLHWNHRRPDRAAQTEAALDFVRRLMACKIPSWAIENPIGCISDRIRPPDQIIQPWQFGDDASKTTCLWLHNLNPLEPTAHCPPEWSDANRDGATRPTADRTSCHPAPTAGANAAAPTPASPPRWQRNGRNPYDNATCLMRQHERRPAATNQPIPPRSLDAAQRNRGSAPPKQNKP